MTILNAILEVAAGLTGISEDELRTWREQARQETGNDDVRLTRERQLNSWTGSSTPISQQIRDSEQHFHNLLEAAIPDIKELLPRLFALELKRHRIDRLKEEHAAKRATSLTGSNSGLHEDYITLAKLLQQLGAGPPKVRQWATEDLVIIADLAGWKAKDPRYKDGDNPWKAIRAIYANRTMEKKAKNVAAGPLSAPGAPPPDGKWDYSTKYWRFGSSDTPLRHVIVSVGDNVAEEGIIVPEKDAAPIARAVERSADTAVRPSLLLPSADALVEDTVAGGTSYDDRPDLVASRMIAASSLAAGRERLAATGDHWHRPPQPILLELGEGREVSGAEPASPVTASTSPPIRAEAPQIPPSMLAELSGTTRVAPSALETRIAPSTLAASQQHHEPTESQDNVDWPDDVTDEVKRAYFGIAREFAIDSGDWQEHCWPFAKASPNDPQSIASMVTEFEELEKNDTLDEVSRNYLDILRRRSISDANDFLINSYAHHILPEVIFGDLFEENRKFVGFPRPSQRNWKP